VKPRHFPAHSRLDRNDQIDAVLPVLQMAGVEPMHIHFDKFTQPGK